MYRTLKIYLQIEESSHNTQSEMEKCEKFNGIVSQKYWKLCLSESFLVFKSLDDCNLLNKRSRSLSKCRHQHKFLLCSASMYWCLYLYFVFIFNIFLLFIFKQNPENMYMNCAWWMWQHEILSSMHIMCFHWNLNCII